MTQKVLFKSNVPLLQSTQMCIVQVDQAMSCTLYKLEHSMQEGRKVQASRTEMLQTTQITVRYLTDQHTTHGCQLYETRFVKTWHNDAFLEFQIFASVSFMYLKLCSVAISMLYC